MNETETFTTHVDEFAVRCLTRDGELYTGNPRTSLREAVASGERLERINGADWWVVTRRRVVTVETSPWTNPTTAAPAASPARAGGA